MLSLGSNIISSSYVEGVSTPRTSFNFERTLDSGVDYFRVEIRNVRHDNDSTPNDNDPKVIISNFQVKIDGVVDSSFEFDSSKMFSTGSYHHATHYSATSIGFEDTHTIFHLSSPIKIYEDTSVSAGAEDSIITVSGNISVTAGGVSNLEYSPSAQGLAGIVQLEFNDVSSSDDRMQIFLDPDVSSSIMSTTGTATKTKLV